METLISHPSQTPSRRLERVGVACTAALALLFAVVAGAAPTAFTAHVLLEVHEHFWHLLVP